MFTTHDFGSMGELYAIKLLKRKGYEIIERNFRCKFGEIDIISKYEDTLVFVEVKTRTGRTFGKPEEAVTNSKIIKIEKVAQYYRLSHPNLPKKSRIDVVAIEVEGEKVTSAKIIRVD